MNDEKTLAKRIYQAVCDADNKSNGRAALVRQAIQNGEWAELAYAADMVYSQRDKEKRRARLVQLRQEIRRQSEDEETGTYLTVERDKDTGKFQCLEKKRKVRVKDEAKEIEAKIEWLRERGYIVTKTDELD